MEPTTKETAATPKLTKAISVNIGLKLSDLTTETKKVNRAMIMRALTKLHANAAYTEEHTKKGNMSKATVMM
jgi:hypothetical protein